MAEQTILATIVTRTLSTVGPGPITSCLSLSYTYVRDAAGHFNASFAAGDKLLQKIRLKEHYLRFTVDGELVFTGLVEVITRSSKRSGRRVVTVSGRCQLGALAENTIGSLVINYAYDGPLQIIGAGNVPNQTFTLDSEGYSTTVRNFYKEFTGESALSALIKTAEEIGEHFRAPTDGNLSVVWMRGDTPAAPIRLVSDGGSAMNQNPGVAIIEDIEVEANGEKMANVIYPYGAGNGDARLTLADATLPMPSGFSIVPASNYIQFDSQQNLPSVRKAITKTFNEVKLVDDSVSYVFRLTADALTGATTIPVEYVAINLPSGTLLDLNGLGVDFVELSTNLSIGANVLNVVATTFDVLESDTLLFESGVSAINLEIASNALASVALNYLRRVSDPDLMVSYNMTVRGLPDDITVGMLIPVTVQEPGIEIDDDLVILEITRTVDRDGRQPATLKVVPEDWFDQGEAAGIARRLEELRTYQAGTQPVDYAAISGTPPATVTSVNGQSGDVLLDPDDLDDTATTNKFVTAAELAAIATAVQPGDLATVAFSGDYGDLIGAPSIPSTFDDLSDGATNKAFTATEKSKLGGIEANADVTDAGNVGSSIHGATGKTTPVDADTMPLIDSAASNVLKKITLANIKAFLKTYFDTLYNLYVHPNHTGDVTSAGDGATTIGASKVLTSMIANDNVTYAKMQNIATDSLIGRDTASAGDPETIGLNATLAMDGAGNLQRAALTGDVTASAGSNTTAIGSNKVLTAMIADAQVTLAKMANLAQDTIIGRASGAGTGVPTALSAAQVVAIIQSTLDGRYGRLASANTWSAQNTFADVVVDASSSVNIGNDPLAANQLSIGGASAFMGINRYVASAFGAGMVFRKSRNPTVGSHTIVQSGDELGKFAFQGSDGTAFRDGAIIVAKADGTPGASDMPTRLEIYVTPDGSATAVLAATVKNDGDFGLGIAPRGKFHVHDGVGGTFFDTFAGVAGSEVEILPAGSVAKAVSLLSGVAAPSSGTVEGGYIGFTMIKPGSGSVTQLYSASLTYKLYSTGQLVIYRTAGSATWTVTVQFNYQ